MSDKPKRKSAWGKKDDEPELEVEQKVIETKPIVKPVTVETKISEPKIQPKESQPNTQQSANPTMNMSRVAKKGQRTKAELKCDSEDEEKNPSNCYIDYESVLYPANFNIYKYKVEQIDVAVDTSPKQFNERFNPWVKKQEENHTVHFYKFKRFKQSEGVFHR